MREKCDIAVFAHFAQWQFSVCKPLCAKLARLRSLCKLANSFFKTLFRLFSCACKLNAKKVLALKPALDAI
jgi:hypothetical protein